MAYLHSDREQFRDAIDLAYEQTGVIPKNGTAFWKAS